MASREQGKTKPSPAARGLRRVEAHVEGRRLARALVDWEREGVEVCLVSHGRLNEDEPDNEEVVAGPRGSTAGVVMPVAQGLISGSTCPACKSLLLPSGFK